MIAVKVRGEHDLWQTVAIEIARRDAAAVVEVAVGEGVQLLRLGNAILERNSGVAGGQLREELPIDGRSLIGRGSLSVARTGARDKETQREQ